MPRFLFKRCLNNHRNPAPATRVPAACLRHLGPQSLSRYSGSGERGPPREWDAGPLRVGRRRDGVPSSESPPFSEAGAAAGMGPVVQADGERDVVNPIAGHRPARRSVRRRPARPRTPWLPSWPRARGLRSRGLPPRLRAGVPSVQAGTPVLVPAGDGDEPGPRSRAGVERGAGVLASAPSASPSLEFDQIQIALCSDGGRF